MKLHLWGTDFRRSPAALRGKFYVAPDKRQSKLRELLSLGFEDLVYLPTCNRVEFYTTAHDYFTDTRHQWLALIESFGLESETYYQGYQLEGKSALRHLLRVSCSLESLVVGESQILGQLKEAIRWNQENSFPLGSSLHTAFQLAFETAKRVRHLTPIGEKSVSVASLALDRIVATEKEYPLTKVAVVGRGPMSVLVVQWMLRERPNVPVLWVNRDPAQLMRFAESKRTEVMSLADFLQSEGVFSHLFTATSSEEVLFRPEFFERGTCAKQAVFDFANPCDVQNEGLPAHVHLVHMDDLQREAQKNASLRKEAVATAERYIDEAIRNYCLVQKQAPLLRDFNSVEPYFSAQLEEAYIGLQKDLPEQYHARLRKIVQKMMKKNLHASREHLRTLLKDVTDPEHPFGV